MGNGHESDLVTVRTLADYEELLQGKRCKHDDRDLSFERLEHYAHGGGWTVAGYEEKQWLYVVCPECEFEWSLWKLGIPQE